MKGKRNLAAVALVVLFVAGFLFLLGDVYAAEPNGVSTFNPLTSERAPNDSAGSGEAQAGNITEVTIDAFSTTQSWQGYVGNISGAIRLADASGDVLYNWSLASPEGEIYASTNESIVWSNIQCFNFTALSNGTLGDGETAGATNLYGTNLSVLQEEFGMSSDDADSVNNTFSAGNNHALFYTASQEFSAGECVSADIFDSAGESTDGNFEEVILYEPTTRSVVFTALIEDDLSGYDSDAHDFQMLVLEDGHGSAGTSTTTYYFFVELE